MHKLARLEFGNPPPQVKALTTKQNPEILSDETRLQWSEVHRPHELVHRLSLGTNQKARR